MPKFRKKPVVIEALQWTGWDEDFERIKIFVKPRNAFKGPIGELIIETFEGNHRANEGDWIIKGIKGECYPCKPDIFEQTYEPVN